MTNEKIERLEELKERYEELVNDLAARGFDDRTQKEIKEQLTLVRAKNNELIMAASEESKIDFEERSEEILDTIEQSVEVLEEVAEDAD